MHYTNNYNFILPDGTDKVNISNINKNFTDIDAYLDEHQTSILNLNNQVLVGGEGTLVSKVDDNTLRIDELEASGGTGGGVTPALYVLRTSSETIGDMTWNIERWSDGYVRCWGDLFVETLDFSTTGATGLNVNFVLAALPTDTFTSKPTFASVMINTNAEGVCNVNVMDLDEHYIVLLTHRTDNSPTVAMTGVNFYIEVRGNASVG